MATDLPPGGEWWPAPECTVIHPYGAEGWRPGADGVHEHYVTVSLNVGFSLTDTEDDDAMRSYVSNLWADDWNSPEDSAYDEPQLTWSLVRLWLALRLNKVPAPHCRIRTWILRTIAGGPKHDSPR